MQCCVDGCDRDAKYKTAKLCQMHYFRVWRNGSLEKKEINASLRYNTPNGYVRLRMPDHPLANRSGCVFEHRYVMWSIVGPDCRPCELCGKPQTWATCHVDHKDEDRKNNSTDNLRILCRGCNVKRGFSAQSYANRSRVGLIEFEGKLDTAANWVRDPRVKVCGATILKRKASGMTDAEALFSDKATHNGNKKIAPARKTNHKHERSNSVAITVEGVTLTAAERSRFEGAAVTENSIISRFRAGWDALDAILTPPRHRPGVSQETKAHYRALVRQMKKDAA